MIQKNLNQPVLITPESSTYNRILSPSFHSFCHSIHPSITLFATLLLHTPYSLILSFILVDCYTSCFCWHTPTASTNSTSSCWKRPYCTCNYMLINLSAYLLGHLSATAVSNCYHSPSDCIGHATSIADTSISIMASAVQFICLSLLLSLCFHYADAECLLLTGGLYLLHLSPPPAKSYCWCYADCSPLSHDEELQQSLLHERVVLLGQNLITHWTAIYSSQVTTAVNRRQLKLHTF